ncbi:MAG: ribonuclease J [Acidobacteria bacterium RIFCSPLOWO2_12_FULL_54_10]|nr:MAG: ribonuclease J [Acidobacteria bacterium RIFCSPLOWO2_12_FULL_54_10]
MSSHKLQAIPLGGLGEFGMNMLALRYGESILVIDAGLMFPEAELFGVDVVIPDISFLIEHRAEVLAIVLTHGHEDHIGALPYVLRQLNVPVYGTPFTIALVEKKLEEHGLLDSVKLHAVKAKGRFQAGPFSVEFIHVTHSIVDAAMLAITTPLGVVMHTGDFKVDPTPTDNELFDLHTIAEYGKKGVLALFSDSTNAERPGYTPSERAVRGPLEDVFSGAENRLYISCFTSSIHRIQLLIDLSVRNNRQVAFVGRSMIANTEIAHRMGFLTVPDGCLLRPNDIKQLPRDRVTVLIAGCQGEPLSSLTRAALESHRHAVIDSGDTVVLSSRIIPGNEKAIYRLINHLFKRGAHVVYSDGGGPPVHVSGHGSQEELMLMLNLTKPRYFIPVHGEYRQLSRHASLAAHLKEIQKIFLMENGEMLEFDQNGARKAERVTAGRICIDYGSVDEIVEDVIISDRRHISRDGIMLPVMAINKNTGKVESQPEIITRGFVSGDNDRILAEAREIVLQTLEQSSSEERADWGVIKEKIRADLKRYISKQTDRHPLIIPVILEI